MNKDEMHRLPGFTAEKALEREAPTSYTWLVFRDGEAGAVELAALVGWAI